MNTLLNNSLRLLGALALAIPALSHADGDAEKCRVTPVGKLDLEFAEGSPLPIANSTLDGKQVRAQISTGAYTTFMMRPTADRLGYRLRSTNGYAVSTGGNAIIYTALLKDFALGASHTGPMRMLVTDNVASENGTDVIVGGDMLLQNDLELALADKSLRMFQPDGGCTNTHLAYWDQEATVVPFARVEQHRPLINIELNGVKLVAMLDSSTPKSRVTRYGAERAGVGFDAAGLRQGDKIGVGNELRDTRIASFDSFAIGDETIKHAELTIIDESPAGRSEVEMVLGADFLRAHRVLFAMSQRRLYLSYVGGSVFAKL